MSDGSIDGERCPSQRMMMIVMPPTHARTHAPLEGLGGVELQVRLHVVEEEAARAGEEALVLPALRVVLLVEDEVQALDLVGMDGWRAARMSETTRYAWR